MAWNIHEKGFTIPKPFHIAKSEKYETSCVSKPLIWRQIVVRRAWPRRIIVVLFWTKCAVRRQIKPGILLLIIKRGQSNFTIVLILASGEGKGYFRVVSVGHLIFDCRMYCGLSHRMQGEANTWRPWKARKTYACETPLVLHVMGWQNGARFSSE